MTIPITEFVWLLILASVTAAAVRWIQIPYTVALVLVGIVVSAFGLLQNVRLTSDAILLVFLPPLLFQAALELDIQRLGRALPAVLLLAIPGVAASTVFIGLPLAWLTPLSVWPALLFGAFISATDPVAVVAAFRRLGAPPSLTSVIEGESLFNDGTALVLSGVLLSAAATGHLGVGAGLLSFIWAVLGGSAIGLILGYVVSEATGVVDDPLIETTISVALAYGSYLLADEVHASAAIAAVLAGLIYGAHGRVLHVSEQSRQTLDAVWTYIGFLANAVLFISIGLAVSLTALRNDLGWVALALTIVLGARALIVYPPTLLLHRVSLAYGHMLFWGSLRGGVALAVALSLPARVPQHSLILTLTFGVVLFTILIQGISIEPLAHRLGVLPETSPQTGQVPTDSPPPASS